MPPRKKVKTDHVQDDVTITRRTTRASSKAANSVTAGASKEDQLPVASVVKLRRGCLKEIPNFAVEIQLMVCLTPFVLRMYLIVDLQRVDL